MTLKKLQIKGLRSLENTGEIELKPITILLGQNSSGKSTYLRSLPLIKQSLESKNNEPLLWYGDLVDFGSYDESICVAAKDQGIGFKLEIEKKETQKIFSKINATKLSIEIQIDKFTEEQESLQKTNAPLPSQSTTTYLIIDLFDNKIRLEFSKTLQIFTEVKINGADFTELTNKSYLLIDQENLIPGLIERSITNEKNAERLGTDLVLGTAKTIFATFLDEIRNSNSPLKTVPSNRLADFFSIESDKEILDTLTKLRQGQQLFKNILSTWTTETAKFKEFKNLLVFSQLDAVIDFVKQTLSDEFRNFSYISPVRASAQRYYRQQAAADNLGAKGENFAYFLKSLKGNNEIAFKNWLSDKLGISITTNESFGHISIYLTNIDDASRKVNLADTGFGYSQLLPIAALIWQTKNSIYNEGNPLSPIQTIAIEQPELHLHPKIQSKIADLLISDEMNIKPATILIETHSEPFINRIGELIECGKIKKDDVSIILFDKENFDDSTKISFTEFNSSGYLTNWPVGFFNSK